MVFLAFVGRLARKQSRKEVCHAAGMTTGRDALSIAESRTYADLGLRGIYGVASPVICGFRRRIF